MPRETIDHMIQRIIKGNIRGSQREHTDAIIAEFEANHELRAELYKYALGNLYPVNRDRVEEQAPGKVVTKAKPVKHKKGFKKMPGKTSVPLAPNTSVPVAPYRPRVTADVTPLVAKVRAIVLLDFVLPTGKMLRDATFGEVRDLGGWLSEIGLRESRSFIIGHHMSERDVQNVFARFFEEAAKVA